MEPIVFFLLTIVIYLFLSRAVLNFIIEGYLLVVHIMSSARSKISLTGLRVEHALKFHISYVFCIAARLFRSIDPVY